MSTTPAHMTFFEARDAAVDMMEIEDCAAQPSKFRPQWDAAAEMAESIRFLDVYGCVRTRCGASLLRAA